MPIVKNTMQIGKPNKIKFVTFSHWQCANNYKLFCKNFNSNKINFPTLSFSVSSPVAKKTIIDSDDDDAIGVKKTTKRRRVLSSSSSSDGENATKAANRKSK